MLSIPIDSIAQTILPLQKISPNLSVTLLKSRSDTLNIIVAVENVVSFKETLPQHTRIIASYEPAKVFTIRCAADKIMSLLQSPGIIFADVQRTPSEELLVGNYDLSTNKVNKVHHQYPIWNGSGLILSVKENTPDTFDIDIRGRYLSTNLASLVYSPHATVMATIAAGAGNSFYQGKGAAWGSTISSSSFASLLPDPDAFYLQNNISVQNHSYGVGIENFYGADARAYDQSVVNNPKLLHVFSAGNSGTQTSGTGPYANTQGYANLTGSFKMAKNIITVGHIDSFGIVLSPSSKGPAYDGRVKPELVAYAEDGSSGAAALVSGIALMVQQAYKETHGNNIPPSSLVRAVLLNSADDVDSAGIDYRSGYGSINAYRAILTIINDQVIHSSVAQTVTQQHPITIPLGIKKMKATLTWNDVPATANATKALVNDLDLQIEYVPTSETWLPWVLSSFPHIDSLKKLPVRKKDTVNNAEQITIDLPQAGNYIIKIHGNTVSTPLQDYSVSWQFDTMDTFTWYYPTGSDNIFPGDSNVLRWQSHYTVPGALLQYSVDGVNWQDIGNMDLTKGYYKWKPPVTFTNAQLRTTIAGNTYTSDTFTVSTPLNMKVGFNCPDSFLIYWNRVPSINSYQVYQLGQKYLQPLTITSDSFIVLPKSLPGFHYSVAPIMDAKPGVLSMTIDYRNQGVECYIKSFLVLLNTNSSSLDLLLGTTYRIQSLTWEKNTLNGFIGLQTITALTGLHYSFEDINLTAGINSYRVKIVLLNGQVLYSNIETIYYFKNTEYIVYPNPVDQSQQATIIAKEPNNEVIQVYNSNGMKVFETVLDDITVRLPSTRWARGLYFIRIVRNGELKAVLKLVVQ